MYIKGDNNEIYRIDLISANMGEMEEYTWDQIIEHLIEYIIK